MNIQHKGISRRPNGKYQARYYVNGRNMTVGTFDRLADAISAREDYINNL